MICLPTRATSRCACCRQRKNLHDVDITERISASSAGSTKSRSKITIRGAGAVYLAQKIHLRRFVNEEGPFACIISKLRVRAEIETRFPYRVAHLLVHTCKQRLVSWELRLYAIIRRALVLFLVWSRKVSSGERIRIFPDTRVARLSSIATTTSKGRSLIGRSLTTQH